MNRLDVLREHIDRVLVDMEDKEERRCAYLHLYGVAQSCALLALKRGVNVELAIMAGMLHDFYSYKYMDTQSHGPRSAELARQALGELGITSQEETEAICQAIHGHSEKESVGTPLDEVLRDADTLQHFLYDPTRTPHNAPRIARVKAMAEELGFTADL